MPSVRHAGATIHYAEFGQGFPILTFAPAGLQSTIEVWSRPAAPINPITEFAGSFRVIALDQRNAGGQSHAPITAQDGWPTYTGDHIGLLDHLRIDRCHLYGQCIGGSFILSLLKAQPRRVASAVLAQPIGRVGAMPAGRSARFEAWVASLKDHPEATPQVLDAHPLPISEELATLLPNGELVREWKTGAALASARARVNEFLSKHTP
jgi:pimeloyl-ACP methyl ester carboxylesterase